MIPTTSRNLAITIRRMAAGPCTVLYQGAVPLISVAYLSLALCLVRIELGAVRGGATCLAGRDAGLWMGATYICSISALALCLVRIELSAMRGGATCLAGRDAGLWMLGLCARVTATTMTTAQSPP